MDLIQEAITAAEHVFLQNGNVIKNMMNYRCDLILSNIIFNENIRVESFSFKNEDICGMLIIDQYEKTIVYNKNQSNERRNFTIAHELGHYFLHRDKHSQFNDRQKNFNHNNGNSLNDLEKQANAFASQLLLPNEIVFYFINNGLHYFQIKKKTQVSDQALYWRLVNYLINNHGLNINSAREIVDEFREFSLASMENMINHKWALIYSIIVNSPQQNFLSINRTYIP